MPDRALSARQAFNCETAREDRCSCRCGGALHGVNRGGGVAGVVAGSAAEIDVAFFEELPPDDPHHLPTELERRRAAKQRASERKAADARARFAAWQLRLGGEAVAMGMEA